MNTKYNISYHYGMDETPRCAFHECDSRYTVNQVAAMFMRAHGGSCMVIDKITAQKHGSKAMNILTKDSPKKWAINPGDVVAVCAWCCPADRQNNVALAGGLITHGVCPSCKDQFKQTIERNKAIQASVSKIDFKMTS